MGIVFALFFFEDLHQVLPVLIFQHVLGEVPQLLPIDITETEGNFFNTRNLEALPFLNDLYKICRLLEGLMGPGIKPGKSAPKKFNLKLATPQIL